MSCKFKCPPPFTHVCDVEEPTTPTDGETKPTWSDRYTGLMCDRKAVTGFETRWNDQQVGLTRERVTMHWVSDIDETMRLRFVVDTGREDVLEILSAFDRDGDRRYLTLICNKLAST